MDKQNTRIITWNTGRLYARNGQPIAAGIVGDMICFVDYARCVYGCYPVAEQSDTDLARDVMRHYDSNKYSSSRECYEFANSKELRALDRDVFPPRKM